MSSRTRDEQSRYCATSSQSRYCATFSRSAEFAQSESVELCSSLSWGFFARKTSSAGGTSSRRPLHSIAIFLLVALWIVMGWLAGQASAQTPSVSYVYDSVGRLVAVYDASGNAAVYSYDLIGNLLSITRYPANQEAAFYTSSTFGQAGSTITIYGTDFCSDPVVTFNGEAATVVSSTSTQINVTIPGGATAGEIVVTCGSNSINAGSFNPSSSLSPSISGFSPASGGPGTTVTITGSGFQPNSVAVTFNNTGALVLSATSSTITAVVPGSATSGPIAVSDSYGQAQTGSNFAVLPPGTVYVANLTAGGSPTSVSFDAGSQQALFTFNGTAGEEVLISFDDPQVDCMSSVTVNNPDGSTLGTFDNLCNGVGFLAEVLPATGVYSIFANDGYDPGSLSVAFANIAQLPTISVGGTAVNVDMPVGTTSALVFQANAGDQISLSATFPGSTSYMDPGVSVVAPDGSIVGSAISDPDFYGGQYLIDPGEYLDSITLTQTGAYALVSASSNEDILEDRDDQLLLQLYSAPTISNTITVGGSGVTLTPLVPGQTAQLTFSGSAGQTISLGLTTKNYFPNVTGTNPDGSSLSFGNVDIANNGFPGTGESVDSEGNNYYYSPAIVLPQSGTSKVNIDFLGETQSAVVKLYDATPESGSISIGGSAVAVSTVPGQSDYLSFSGTTSQQISFCETNSTYLFGDPVAWITNPDGSFLGLDFNLVYNPSNYSCELLTLPQSGTYVAQITSSPPQPEFFTTGNEPGTADVQIFDGTPINDSISFDGPPVSISSNPGQPVDLNFSGTAGQYGMLTISGSGYTGAVVLNPDGSYLSGDPIIDGQLSLGVPSLPTSGTYTVELFENPTSGSATVQLSSLHQENYTTSIGGSPVDVTLQVQGQDANITFSANAGQWISLTTSNSTLDGCAEIELLNPDGSWANSVYACDPSDFMYATQLTQSGTYSIFVDGQGSMGSIDVQVNDATPVSGTISIDGASANPTMSEPSQNFEYTFTGTTGQEIGLSVTSFSSYGDCSPEIYILDPSGNYVDGQILNPSYWPDGTASLGDGNDVLSSDGTYSIFLDNTGCSSGTAEVTLFSSNTETGAITFNGDTVTAPSTLPGQPMQLTISGGAGQTVYLNTSNSTYQDCVNIVLDDPTSSVVDDLWQCGDTGTMGPDTLSSDGYTIWVYPLGEAGSVDLSLSSQSAGGGGSGPD